MKETYRRSISFHLARLAKLQTARTRQLLGGADLHPGQDHVLRALAEHGAMTMGELAEALGVRAPTATKAISRLAGQGLVERAAAGADGRVVKVSLTETGAALAEKTAGVWAQVETEMLGEFDGKELRRLRKGLRRAGRNLAKAGGISLDGTEPDTEDDEAESG